MKFRKKPVVIEAVRFDGDMTREGLYIAFGWPETFSFPFSIRGQTLLIPTLEGTMTANVGDWIIKGVKGEFYPIKNDIFLQTYEAVDATQEQG